MADHEPQLNEQQINGLVQEMQREYAPHFQRLKVRRMLIEMTIDAQQDGAGTGVNVPAPFDRSTLIIRSLGGDAVDAVRHYSSRIAANPPQPVVLPPTIGQEEITKRVEEHAAEQERMLSAMWNDAGGRQAQWQIAWSMSWGRVGFYLSEPREAAWGLPDRAYFDDLTDDEIETLKRDGRIAPEPFEDQSGKLRHVESGSTWLERRRKAAQDNAVAGRSLNTLEALPPDVVLVREDRDGFKYVAVVQEMPASDLRPGSNLMIDAARHAGTPLDDIGKYGLYVNKNGQVEGGVTKGGEPGSVRGQRWMMTRFFTRSESYYLVSTSGVQQSGKIIWHDEHGDGVVPLVAAPAMRTDSMRPGAEYHSPMESVFALQPLLNQVETLLSNTALWDGIPRYVVEDTDGNLVRDPETGDPKVWQGEPGIGFDPRDIAVVGGKVRQLKIEADLLLKMLEFYAADMERKSPRGITPDAVGAGAPAWNVRQFITEAQTELRQAVDNNAEATQQIMRIWINRARRLDVPIFFFAAPGKRKSDETRRGLVEFDPANLVESIRVVQSSETASDRIALQQHGIELLAAGRIDDLRYFEEYALEPDAEEAVLRSYVQKVSDFVLLGDTSQIQEGSVLWEVAKAVKGQLVFQLMERSPNFALAAAEQAAANAQGAGQPQLPEAGGNVAEAAGVVQPGLGMAQNIPGTPQSGAPAPPVAAPVVAR